MRIRHSFGPIGGPAKGTAVRGLPIGIRVHTPMNVSADSMSGEMVTAQDINIIGDGRKWLSDGLSHELMLGSRQPERMQLAAALSSANRLLVSDQVCEAADILMLRRPSTIPWDRIAFPPVTWMEYSPAARPALRGLITPITAGVLLLRDPGDPDSLLVTGGWRGHEKDKEDKMGLWGAAARWSMASLREGSIWTDAEAQQALISTASFWLLGEPTSDEAAASSRWRLSLEATFAFSVLALLTTSSVRLETLEDEREFHEDAESSSVDIVPAARFLDKVARLANPLGGIWLPPLIMPVWTIPAAPPQGAGIVTPVSVPVSVPILVEAA